MPKQKTHKEYVAEVARINPNLEVLGVYINSYTKVLHKCKIHNYEWYVTPNRILCGVNCPVCSGRVVTHEEYVKKVAKINFNIEVLERYIDSKTPILHRCKIDGYEWYVKPNGILNGTGCPKCAGTMKKTHEEYVKELYVKNPNIEVVELYVNDYTKILHRCKIDAYEWYTTPRSILDSNGGGCPKCSGSKQKTHEEYVFEVAKINPNIEVIGEYVNWETKILHRCKIDGCEWYARPNNILNGNGCPKCNASKGERTIAIWLDRNNISYEPQKIFKDCKDKRYLPFDFYLPNYNICVEYNGIQHYEPIGYFGGEEGFKGVIKRDKIKKDYCNANNILLVAIPYYLDINNELENLYSLIKMKNTEKGVAV